MAKLTIEQIMSAITRDDGTGFCVRCGAENSYCEPDARKRKCETCGARAVYGAEELLLMGVA